VPDSLDAIARMGGLTRRATLDIWEGVRANHAALDACPGPHDFSVPLEQPLPHMPARRWACSRCGGAIDVVAKSWYEKGLKHATAPGA
jgi:hypothetical protein